MQLHEKGPPAEPLDFRDMVSNLLNCLTPDQRRRLFARWDLQERLAELTPEERLAGLTPKERLAGLSLSDLEECVAWLNVVLPRVENGDERMTGVQRVAKITEALPFEKQAEVLDFVEFLRSRAVVARGGAPAGKPQRKLGFVHGECVIADDFDAPLPPEIQPARPTPEED